MIVSPGGRFVFIHVPKTGGFSMRTLLRISFPDAQDIFARHCRARDASVVLREWGAYFRFGFVRNPWAAQLSMYHYVLGSGPQHPDWEAFRAYGSFARYLDQHLRPTWEEGRLLTQSDYLCGDDGADLMSFVGRFEALERDFAEVCAKLNRPVGDLPRLNASEHGPYRDHYDAASQALVERAYAKDIERFGYAF